MKNKFDYLSKNGLILILMMSFSALNAQYDFDWAKEYSRYDYNSIINIGSDADNNYYVVGRVYDTIDVDFGTAVLDLNPFNTSTSMFVAKYSSAGALTWAAHIGNNNAEVNARSMSVDPSGNIYITGTASTQTNVNIDFDPGPDTFNLASISSSQRFQWVLKLNTNGEFRWVDVNQSNAISGIQVGTINHDSQGNVFVSGTWENNLDLGAPLNITLTSPTSKFSSFVAKYNANGVMQWAKSFIYDAAATTVGTPYSTIKEILVQSDDIFLVGTFDGRLDFNPGAGIDSLTALTYTNSVLIGLDSSGNYNFAQLVPASISKSLLDDTGNIYMTGGYTGTVDFDPSTAVVNQTSTANSDDAYVAKYTNNGNLIWVKSYGGLDDDYTSSMALDNDNNILITGFFTDTVDFNPGAGINQLSAFFFYDSYLLKLNSSGDYLSAYSWGGTLNDYTDRMLIDNAGAVLIAGYTYSTDIVYDQFRGGSPSKKYLMKLLPQTTAVIGNSNETVFSIFPNPAKNQFTISEAAIGANVRLYDITGKLLISEIMNDEILTVSTEQLANGLYIVQLENKGQISQMKLVIRK